MTDNATPKPFVQDPPAEPMTEADLRLRYTFFQRTTVSDQIKYYNATADRNQTAVRQVNQIRASLALLTGLASSLSAILVQLIGENSQINQELLNGVVQILTIMAVALPAVAAAFNTLADLYQWDRTKNIYKVAEQTLGYAVALEPNTDEKVEDYSTALIAHAEAALAVMRDEQAQWGQNIRTPGEIDTFIQEQISKNAQRK